MCAYNKVLCWFFIIFYFAVLQNIFEISCDGDSDGLSDSEFENYSDSENTENSENNSEWVRTKDGDLVNIADGDWLRTKDGDWLRLDDDGNWVHPNELATDANGKYKTWFRPNEHTTDANIDNRIGAVYARIVNAYGWKKYPMKNLNYFSSNNRHERSVVGVLPNEHTTDANGNWVHPNELATDANGNWVLPNEHTTDANIDNSIGAVYARIANAKDYSISSNAMILNLFPMIIIGFFLFAMFKFIFFGKTKKPQGEPLQQVVIPETTKPQGEQLQKKVKGTSKKVKGTSKKVKATSNH